MLSLTLCILATADENPAVDILLGSLFIVGALNYVGRVALSIRLHRLAWTGQERTGMLVLGVLVVFLCFVMYMPDGYILPRENASDAPYGPGRRAFGLLGMIAGGLMFLSALSDGVHALVRLVGSKSTDDEARQEDIVPPQPHR